MRAEDLHPLEMINFDAKSGFPMVGRHRAMTMGVQTLVRLEKDLTRILGWPKMSILLTRFGYEWGLTQAAVLRDLYDFDSPEELLKAGSILRRMSGLVDEQIDEVSYNPDKKALSFKGVWRDSFEVLIALSESWKRPDPGCHILTGMVSGFASAVFDMEVLVREISCQSGCNTMCCFEGRQVEEWGLDLMEVKQYFAVTYLDEELARTRTLIEQAQQEMHRQSEEIRALRNQTAHPAEDHGLIYRSPAMEKILILAEKVAPTGSTVLIQGESGTGKEVIARFIHRHSGREDQPFMAINCAALPPNLLESELFGHVKGAFTGADSDKKGLFVEAGRGSLFLDEVAEMPQELQAKLLRALQQREVRPVGGARDIAITARIIAASNQDLRDMVVANRFREDLFYRLSVFPLKMTPLRERRQDILLLARHFLGRFRPGHAGFSPATIRLLEHYAWPGNVRELENWIEYAVVLAGEERILPEHLPLSMMQKPLEQLSVNNLAQDLPTVEELEKRYIQLVLDQTGGNKSEAARLLGLSISTLWRRLKDRGQEA
jgi:DNA-binding NtrC family response regulator/predicted hydrocarbon binding protein